MAERDPSQRVVITGIGVAAPTPNGLSVEGFWEDLRHNRHGVREIPEIIGDYHEIIQTKIGAPLADFDLKTQLEINGFDIKDPNIHKEQRRWHRSAKAVVYGGAMALRQADLLKGSSLRTDPGQVLPTEFGVYEGTGIAGSLMLVEIQKVLDDMLASIKKKEKYEGKQVSPFDILHFLGGRVDEIPAMLFNAKAFNDTVLTECAAGLSSIDRAVDELRLGRAKVVLAGGVETAAHPATIIAFEETKALNTKDSPKDAPRPFSASPGGLVLGEGAGQVVLETLEHALRRRDKLGAKVTILAEVLGAGKSSDAYKDTYPSDEGAERAMRMAIKDAGLEPGEISDLFSEAHATSTEGDIEEFRAIKRIFEPHQVVGISSIKGHTGHTFGGAGTLGVITGIQSMRDNVVPPNRNMHEPNPETVGWEMVPNKAKQVERVGMVMVNAFGFGGKNRVVLLGKPEAGIP